MSRRQRTNAQTWRKVESPVDSSPAPRPAGPSLEEWGVTQDEARDMLRRQVCPACGEGPWKSPLNHAARKHGIDRFTMRDLCGLILRDSVVDPELSERIRERGRSNDMSAVGTTGAGSRRQYRHTQVGIERVVANLEEFNARPDAADLSRKHVTLTKTPEAQAKRSATFAAKRGERA